MKKLFIDLETTGLNHLKCSILQISAIMEIEDSISNFDIHVKPFPGDEVSEEALRVNKVKREELNADYRVSQGAAFEKLENFLGVGVDRYNKADKFHMVGYNVSGFDLRFLRKFFERNGSKYFNSWFYYPAVDVMYMASYILANERSQMANFKMGTVAKHLGIVFDKEDLHSAEVDIDVTRKMYIELIKRFRGMSHS